MLRYLAFIFSYCWIILTPAKAANAEVFTFDETRMNRAFASASLAQFDTSNHVFFHPTNTWGLNTDDDDKDMLLGIPAFWWGFGPALAGGPCAGGVTSGYLYFGTGDKNMTGKSMIGCLAGTVLRSGCFLAYLYIISFSI